MSVRRYLVTLPERLLRSATLLTAGVLRTTAAVLLPRRLRQTRLYRSLVDSTLQFLIERVGDMPLPPGEVEQLPENFLLRRTAGNGIELLGIVAFHVSPVWFLAAAADATGAGRHLLSEIAEQLKRDGVLDSGASIETADQLLEALERTSARLAETCNTPPLDFPALQAECRAVYGELSRLPAPQMPSIAVLQELWSQMRGEAGAQRRPVWDVSSAVALSTARSLQTLAGREGGYILAQYRASLEEMHRIGFGAYWRREFSPYLRAAARHFSTERKTWSGQFVKGVAVLLLVASGAAGQAPVVSRFSPDVLKSHVSFLADDSLHGRDTPSESLNVAAAYIASQFRSFGLAEGAPGYFQVSERDEWSGPKGTTTVVEAGLKNVIGVIPGRTRQYVLVTAHYDHVGEKGEEQDRIFNGANDNASSVAALIEIARKLKALNVQPRRSIVFIAFFGEEKGLWGSRYYARHPLFPLRETVFQLNMEQLGRTDDSEGPRVRAFNMTGFGFTTAPATVGRAARVAGVRLQDPGPKADDYFGRSDNIAFSMVGVPSTTVSVAYGFPDYHKASDHWDKLDYRNMAAVSRGIAAGVWALAEAQSAPRWVKANPKVERYIKAYEELIRASASSSQ